MIDPREIIELLSANLRKTDNPLGVPASVLNTWWRGLPLPRDGTAMLFTGLLYQSVPYIEPTTRYLALLEDSPWSRIVRLGRLVPPLVAGSGLRFLVERRQKERFDGILRDIWHILKASQVDFFYRPELDLYSGILLHDLGDEEGFARHAAFVARKLKAHGVRRLITVDPHTTYAVKVLYPRYTGESFEVRTYFEVSRVRAGMVSAQGDTERVTLHDPCFYGRFLELADRPRRILEDLGIEQVPVRHEGLFTRCCGGPVESISPRLTREVRGRRVEELTATGASVVAMCPICLGNLLQAGLPARDLSSLMSRRL